MNKLRVTYRHTPITENCGSKRFFFIDIPELEHGFCQTPTIICMDCQTEAEIVSKTKIVAGMIEQKFPHSKHLSAGEEVRQIGRWLWVGEPKLLDYLETVDIAELREVINVWGMNPDATEGFWWSAYVTIQSIETRTGKYILEGLRG